MAAPSAATVRQSVSVRFTASLRSSSLARSLEWLWCCAEVAVCAMQVIHRCRLPLSLCVLFCLLFLHAMLYARFSCEQTKSDSVTYYPNFNVFTRMVSLTICIPLLFHSLFNALFTTFKTEISCKKRPRSNNDSHSLSLALFLSRSLCVRFFLRFATDVSHLFRHVNVLLCVNCSPFFPFLFAISSFIFAHFSSSFTGYCSDNSWLQVHTQTDRCINKAHGDFHEITGFIGNENDTGIQRRLKNGSLGYYGSAYKLYKSEYLDNWFDSSIYYSCSIRV